MNVCEGSFDILTTYRTHNYRRSFIRQRRPQVFVSETHLGVYTGSRGRTVKIEEGKAEERFINSWLR